MVALVDRMLELNEKKHSVAAAFRPPQERVRLKADATPELDRLERDIASTDAEIDELVYALYSITDEARTIVENM
jgi:hypothetical protein